MPVESDINSSERSLMTPIPLGYNQRREIKALKEELFFMKKNHEEEVNGLRN